MMGLPIFGKEGSGTPVFKIVVRARESWPFEILMDPLENLMSQRILYICICTLEQN